MRGGTLEDFKKRMKKDKGAEASFSSVFPLHLACNENRVDFVKYLLEKKKLPIDLTDKNGWTALHCACYNGHLELVKYLLSQHANPASLTNDGGSTLFYLVKTDSASSSNPVFCECLDALLQAGVKVNLQNPHGETPLHAACLRGNLSVVEFLLNRNADPNLCNKFGETCGHMAAKTGHTDIMKILLMHGLNPDIQSANGTCLDVALNKGHRDIVQLLEGRTETVGDKDVCKMLQDLGLDKYRHIFTKEEVDRDTLKMLKRHDLERMSIPTGPRRKILAKIKEFRREDGEAVDSDDEDDDSGSEEGGDQAGRPHKHRKGKNTGDSAGPDSRSILESTISTQDWEIPYDDLKIGPKIGAGGFGIVYKGEWRGAVVAIKKLKQQQLTQSQLAEFRHEASIMKKLRPHTDVVLFLGVVSAPPNLCIVTEYLPYGDLASLLLDHNVNISLKTKVRMAISASAGLLHLHRENIVHRDLAARNLLIKKDDNGNMDVRVCDFGYSRENLYEVNNSDSGVGPLKWMAPESLRRTFTKKSDVWSFGVVLWEMLARSQPYPDHSPTNAAKAVLTGYRMPIPPDTPPSLSNMITECWQLKPEDRPDFGELNRRLRELYQELCAAEIGDPLGSHLWKSYFDLRAIVEWKMFLKAFCETTKVLPPTLDQLWVRCLMALLVTNENETVQVEEFAKVLGWFGPMSDVYGMLDRLTRLLSHRWFHGDVTAQQAEQLLMGRPPSTFLVRFSSTGGNFSISVLRGNSRIEHYRIRHMPERGYLFQGQTWSHVDALITDNADKLGLLHPCPGSKFEHLFRAQQDAAPQNKADSQIYMYQAGQEGLDLDGPV